jgi:hypothetical protein
LHLGIDRQDIDPLERDGADPRYHARLANDQSIRNACATDPALNPGGMMARPERKRNLGVIGPCGRWQPGFGAARRVAGGYVPCFE